MDSSSEMEKHEEKKAYLDATQIPKLQQMWEGNRMHTAIKMQKTAAWTDMPLLKSTENG